MQDRAVDGDTAWWPETKLAITTPQQNSGVSR